MKAEAAAATDVEFIVVITTVPTRADADRLAGLLVGGGLAACVNIHAPVSSVYRWRGRIEREAETMMWIKSLRVNYGRIEALIAEHHSHELPEIIALPVLHAEKGYGDWLRTHSQGSPADT